MLRHSRKALVAGLLMATALAGPAQARVVATFEDGTQLIDAYPSPLPKLGGLIAIMVALGASGAGGDDDDLPKRWLLDTRKTARDLYLERLLSDLTFIGTYADQAKIESAIKRFTLVDRAAIDLLNARDEYKKNPALLNHGVAAKHAEGLTGKGISVAVIDDGFDRTNPNLAPIAYGGEFNPFGYDFAKSRYDGQVTKSHLLRHGTVVAQVLAGANNGDYNLGVAPGVTLYNVHAVGNYNELGLAPSLWHDGAFKYIADNNIDIANGSFKLDTSNTYSNAMDYDRAMGGHVQRAINNGTIFVFATGNDALHTSDSLMVKMGADPRANGQIVAVAALRTDADGIASFSNYCGAAKNYCISAVGENVPVRGNDGHSEVHSGTSVAAPIVSGALALLKEKFPELAPSDLVELIFVTADDLGEAGIDEVYGRGALNIGRAFQPVGGLRILTSSDLLASVDAADEMIISNGSVGKTIATALDQKAIVLIDDFDRGFATTMSQFVITNEARSRPIAEAGATFDLGFAKLSTFGDKEAVLRIGGKLAIGYGAVENIDDKQTSVLRYGYDPRGWIGEATAVTFAPMNNLTFGAARAGSGTGATAIWAGFGVNKAETQLSFSAGVLDEQEGFMGATFGSGTGKAAYVSASFMTPVTDGVSAGLTGVIAKADYKGGALVSDGKATLASLKADVVIDNVLGGKMTFTLGTPLHVANGDLGLDVVTGRGPGGEVLRERQNVSLSGGGRPVDFGVKHEMTMGKNMGLELSVAARHQGGKTTGWLGIQVGMKF